MLDQAAQARIQELFRRENRSFLQYVRQASPWTGPNDKPVLDKLYQLADEELAALEALAQWMESSNIPLPYLGAFATRFSSFNFVDVRKLIKPLLAEQRRELADLEADARSLDGDPKKRIDALVDLNRKHLTEMEGLGG